MRKMVFVSLLLAAVAFSVCGCTSSKGLTPMEKKQNISDLRNDVVDKLVASDPVIRRKVKESPGYAVFSNVSVNLILAEAGNGFGVVIDNKTGKKTYMKMGLGGIGIGLGVKDFRQLMIFKTTTVMNNFVEKGWEIGAHAEAAATAGEKGGKANTAGDIASGVEIYQVTENGLALQATLTAAKYWKDKELN